MGNEKEVEKTDREILQEKFEEHRKEELAKEKPVLIEGEKVEPKETPKETPKEEIKEVPKVEEKPKPPTDLKVTPAEKGDAVAPTEKDAPAKVVKEEKVKMVPHAALHEERLRSKEIRQELEKMKSTHDSLLEEIRGLKDDREAGIGTVDDNEAKTLKLERELLELKSAFSKRTMDEQNRIIKQNQQSLNERIRLTNEELEADGIKGFNVFKAQVVEELQKLVEEDPANEHLDNPEGWKKIYKETVLPRVSSMFAEKAREEKVKEKEALAEEAKLVSSPGSAPAKEPEEEMSKEEQYIKMRRERAASST